MAASLRTSHTARGSSGLFARKKLTQEEENGKEVQASFSEGAARAAETAMRGNEG